MVKCIDTTSCGEEKAVRHLYSVDSYAITFCVNTSSAIKEMTRSSSKDREAERIEDAFHAFVMKSA